MKTVSDSSSLSGATRNMIIAVYELNGKVLKTTNLTKKLKKVKPDKILFQTEFTGSTKDAEKILDDWLRAEEDNESTGGWKVSIYKPDGTSYHSISFDRISKYFDKRYDFLWYDGCVV